MKERVILLWYYSANKCIIWSASHVASPNQIQNAIVPIPITVSNQLHMGNSCRQVRLVNHGVYLL